MTVRPLVLLPPSKGKSATGDGPAYGATLADDAPLTGPRREVLAALATDVGRLDDRALARLAGVPARDVDEHRRSLPALAGAATTPAAQRYTGVVHGNAGLADRDPTALGADVRIVSALLGLAALDEPVPAYRLELAAPVPSLGGLGPFWRERLADHLDALAADRRVWDLLPGEHRRVWTAPRRDHLDVVDVRFVRPDGRAANAARTKVAKGRLAGALLDHPAVTPAEIADVVDLGVGWHVTSDGPVVTAVSHH